MNKSNFNNKIIYVFASEIGSIINQNPYTHYSDMLLKYWKKYNENDYYSFIKNHVPDCDIVDSDKFIEQSKIKYGLDINLDSKNENLEEIKQLKNNIETEINNKNIEKSEKNKIIHECNSILNKKFGIDHEINAIKIYEKNTSTTVNKDNKFYKKKIINYEGFNWYFCGKVDGISSSNVLVEVKNRMNKIFGKIPFYEKPQVHCYMYLLDTNMCHFIECYKSLDVEISIIEEKFNSLYWNNIIIKIKKFIYIYNKLLKSNNLKKMLLIDNDDEKNDFFNKIWNKVVIK